MSEPRGTVGTLEERARDLCPYMDGSHDLDDGGTRNPKCWCKANLRALRAVALECVEAIEKTRRHWGCDGNAVRACREAISAIVKRFGLRD